MIAILVLSIISIFVFSLIVEAYIGLVIGVLYVIFDTQIIIHRTEQGIFDPFTDAKHLFLDLIKIFIKIVQILNANKKEKKKN